MRNQDEDVSLRQPPTTRGVQSDGRFSISLGNSPKDLTIPSRETSAIWKAQQIGDLSDSDRPGSWLTHSKALTSRRRRRNAGTRGPTTVRRLISSTRFLTTICLAIRSTKHRIASLSAIATAWSNTDRLRGWLRFTVGEFLMRSETAPMKKSFNVMESPGPDSNRCCDVSICFVSREKSGEPVLRGVLIPPSNSGCKD